MWAECDHRGGRDRSREGIGSGAEPSPGARCCKTLDSTRKTQRVRQISVK